MPHENNIFLRILESVSDGVMCYRFLSWTLQDQGESMTT